MRSEIKDIQLLTVEELCQLLKKSKGSLYQMVLRRQIPGIIKIGKSLRFRAEVINTWLKSCEVEYIPDNK